MGYSYRLDAGIGRARVEDPGARSLVRTAGPGDQSGTGHADHTCREPASVSFAALRPGQANRIPRGTTKVPSFEGGETSTPKGVSCSVIRRDPYAAINALRTGK